MSENTFTEKNTFVENMSTENKYVPRTYYLCHPKKSTYDKAKQIHTFTFTYDDNGNVTYGGSVFRRNKPDEVFNKKALRETANARFKIRPIHFKMDEKYIQKNEKGRIEFKNVIKELSNHLGKEGVRGKIRMVKKTNKIVKTEKFLTNK